MKYLLSILLLLPVVADSATNNLADCAQATLTSAISSGADGDTYVFPSGGCSATWTSTITPGKEVHLRGAGDLLTIISGSHSTWINFGTNNSTVGGICFTNTGSGTPMLVFQSDFFQVFSNRMVNTTTKVVGISVTGGTPTSYKQAQGVIWKNTLINCRIYMQGDLRNDAPGGTIWASSTYLPGTTNTCFIEQNLISRTVNVGRNMIDWDSAGHATVRFNTFTNGSIQSHGINAQALTPKWKQRATRFVEAYGNTWYRDGAVDTSGEGPLRFRGGMAIAYSNTVNGTWEIPAIQVDDPRLASYSGSSAAGEPDYFPGYLGDGDVTNETGTHDGGNNSSSFADSSKSWTTDEWQYYGVYNDTDGSAWSVTANNGTTLTVTLVQAGTDSDFDNGDTIRITQGWPLRDQIGTSTDVGDNSGAYDYSHTNSLAASAYWDNTYGGADMGISVTSYAQEFILDGRDITNAVPSWYSAYTYPHPARIDQQLPPAASGSSRRVPSRSQGGGASGVGL